MSNEVEVKSDPKYLKQVMEWPQFAVTKKK